MAKTKKMSEVDVQQNLAVIHNRLEQHGEKLQQIHAMLNHVARKLMTIVPYDNGEMVVQEDAPSLDGYIVVCKRKASSPMFYGGQRHDNPQWSPDINDGQVYVDPERAIRAIKQLKPHLGYNKPEVFELMSDGMLGELIS